MHPTRLYPDIREELTILAVNDELREYRQNWKDYVERMEDGPENGSPV